ncbi:MAG: DUF92 domain-containing protein [Candidatus Micrarchaeota archaeon]
MTDFSYFIAIIAALFLASIAARFELLSEGGIFAAVLIGLTIYFFGGWNWFMILAVFFIIASSFTKYRISEKREVNREFAKGGVRDFWQVAANGALGALIAVINTFYPTNTSYFAFLGVIAAATADTLATEIGVLSKEAYLITNLKKVEKGVSGAISKLGTAAAISGSLLIGLVAVILSNYFMEPAIDPVFLLLIPLIAGTFGALLDSFLGATVQVMYWCPKCKKQTEREVHKCNSKTTYYKGIRNINNDTVNLISTIGAGLLAAGLYQLLKGY